MSSTLISTRPKYSSQAAPRQSGRINREFWLRAASLLVIFAVGLAAYLLFIRPSQIRRGATDAEVARVMPGDDIVSNPTFNATRAVTINAPPEKIWPWLVQWGYGKAGFYGYDLVENIGSPSGMISADRIVPEYQHLAVGDKVEMNDAYYFFVNRIEPGKYILLGCNTKPCYGSMLWSLEPIDANHTRVIHRLRMQYQWLKPDIPVLLFTDLADHVAVRKLLLGLKDRAEGTAEPFANQALELGLYLLLFVEWIVSMGLVLTRRPWAQTWTLALSASASLLFTLYSSADLWIKALLAVVLLAALVRLFLSGQRQGNLAETRAKRKYANSSEEGTKI